MTTTTKRETEIYADPNLPTVRISREFDATPDKVFRAWTEPELFAQWIGPRGIGMRIEKYDARTGGSYRYVHSDDDGEYGFYGSFHEVRANERIVQTFTFDGMPDGVSLSMITFEDLGDGRTRLVSVDLLESMEARDGMLASGMEVGVREGYEKLDELLASQT
ncbi:MAG TPA: SRPBCC family protein [Jiangellaceae bacterium]|nr:SRPBCC family protein [Jiangellaceae bacterium]